MPAHYAHTSCVAESEPYREGGRAGCVLKTVMLNAQASQRAEPSGWGCHVQEGVYGIVVQMVTPVDEFPGRLMKRDRLHRLHRELVIGCLRAAGFQGMFTPGMEDTFVWLLYFPSSFLFMG